MSVVIILPNDETKIAVWLKILDLREKGMGYKAIANYLNEIGIPSPDAGRSAYRSKCQA